MKYDYLDFGNWKIFLRKWVSEVDSSRKTIDSVYYQ